MNVETQELIIRKGKTFSLKFDNWKILGNIRGLKLIEGTKESEQSIFKALNAGSYELHGTNHIWKIKITH
jgi:hypothetical protein